MSLQFDCRHRFPSGFSLDVQFEIDRAWNRLSGDSGSGKSTVLQMIAGVLNPDSGLIVCNEETCFESSTGKNCSAWKRDVGLVFQENLLFPHLTVKDNLSYAEKRSLHSVLKKNDVTSELELEELLGRYPRDLSGGQARRVAIGRVLLQGPKLLLLDEPWVGLDQRLKEKTIAFVSDFVMKHNALAVLVSHDQQDCGLEFERTVELKDGLVQGKATDDKSGS